MAYSLNENLDMLRENKQALLDKLDAKLAAIGKPTSGLTTSSSWQDIANYIGSLETYEPLPEFCDGDLEKWVSNTFDSPIEIKNTTISTYSFYGKTSLTSLVAKSVTSIGSYAFYNCNNLTNLELIKNTNFDLSNLTNIGEHAFYNCTKLAKTSLLLNAPCTIGGYAFNGINDIKEIIITKDVKTINNYAFAMTDGYQSKFNARYILCEYSSRPSSWGGSWNHANYYGTITTYWNCTEKDFVIMPGNGDVPSVIHSRILWTAPTTPERVGYTFAGWTVDGSNSLIFPYTTADENPTISAMWARSYKIIVNDIENNEAVEIGSFILKNLNDMPSGKNLGYIAQGYYIDSEMTIELTDLSQLDNQIEPQIEPIIYVKGTGLVIFDFEYTGAAETALLWAGTYKLECWGAQGGYYDGTNGYGGAGGYSVGTLLLDKKTNIFVSVGQCGGYNGSSIYNSTCFGGGGATNYYGSSGGGASDIRIGTNSLFARIIVAGGGGGHGYSTTSGGYGGGIVGGQGGNGSTVGGNGGTQTGGGTNNTPGNFGSAVTNSSNGGGGGGGWYGGASGCGSSVDSGGGGGSGYVYTSATYQNYPSGCLLNSNYYLTNAQTIAGNQSFVAPNGTAETGHSGNGYVRITKIS